MSPLSILVVDDSADDRKLVRRYLRDTRRYAVREASSGREGLEQLERGLPDVLILDQHLGEMTGNEVLSALRERGHSELAVIVLTGSEALDHDPLELGADDFLNKDEINERFLRRTVDNAIVKARMRHGLERSRAQLREALDEVTRRMEFESRLMGVVGHDLRSPLQSIRIGVQALLEESRSSMEQRTLQLVSRSVDHMVRMVEQLLDLTRTRKAGCFPVVRVESDACELVGVRVAELRAAHPHREICCVCNGDGKGNFDPTAFGQLVHNLVGNAIRHGSPEHPVMVQVEGRADEIELLVSNGGRPIPGDQLPSLFEPFARGHGSVTGLGLGLYIAQEIARAHGGRLSATSDPERTVFAAILPRRASSCAP